MTTIQNGTSSGIREPLTMVVRTQGDWDTLWKRHASIQSPPPPAPAVDFSREMVAGVFAGEKNTGGYEVEITGVEVKDSRVYVRYGEKAPPSGGIVTQALTQPFHLIKLPKSDMPIVFEKMSR